MALARQVVVAVRIDDRNRIGERSAYLVMVEHHDVRPRCVRSVDRGAAVGAAVDGHDQRRAAPCQFPHRIGIRPISLEDSVRNVDFRLDAVVAEETLHQRRRRRAVDVVVAEDRHPFAPLDGAGDPLRRLFHAGERSRVGQEVANGRIEEAEAGVGINAAPGEHPRDDVLQAMVLCDRKRDVLVALG